MKTKLLLVLFPFLFSCLYVNAQLKVNSNGKVGIGTANPQYGLLQIGKSGENNGIAIYDSLKSLPPFKMYTLGDYAYFHFDNSIYKGLRIRKNGHIDIGANFFSEGWQDLINVYVDEKNPCSVLAADVDYPFDYGYALKVMVHPSDIAFLVQNRDNNLEHTFRLSGDGSIYSKGSILTASDAIYKNNVEKISNGLEILKKMEGVTYSLNNQNSLKMKRNSSISFDSVSTNVRANVSFDLSNKIISEKQRKKVGFIAQELEKIFPEVVYTTIDGTKAIAYSEIIPLLVEAIKEQQVQIEALQQAKNNKTRSVENELKESSENLSAVNEREQAALFSNIPNPFKEETTISYFIPEDVSKASLHIYNLQGKQIKQMNLWDRGRGAVVIKGHELNPGMYMYTLIADGKEVDTKKMILTE